MSRGWRSVQRNLHLHTLILDIAPDEYCSGGWERQPTGPHAHPLEFADLFLFALAAECLWIWRFVVIFIRVGRGRRKFEKDGVDDLSAGGLDEVLEGGRRGGRFGGV